MKAKWNLRQARMIALGAVATCLAFVSLPVQATITYSSGGTVNVTTLETDVASGIRVQVSNGTTLNWATGADYSPTANFNSSGVNEVGFQITDTSVLNLSGGNLAATDSDDAVDLTLVESLAIFSGAVSMSGGTFGITESGGGGANVFRFDGSGIARLTLSVSGGSATLNESGNGNLNFLIFTGGATGDATVSGGTFNLNEATGGTARLFNITGGSTVAKVTVTGGSFTMTEAGNGDSSVFDINSSSSELWIRGGSFAIPGTSTNSLDAGAVLLFGTFPGVSDGVYTDANWIDGTVLGGALELGGTLGDAYTVVGGSGRLYINTVPEPSALALVGLGLFGWLVFRRRA